jgi:hypothetical protein
MARCFIRWNLSCVWMMVLSGLLLAAEPVAVAPAVSKAFAELSDEEKRRLIVERLSERIKKLENIRFVATEELNNFSYVDGKRGDMVKPFWTDRVDYRSNGESYRHTMVRVPAEGTTFGAYEEVHHFDHKLNAVRAFQINGEGDSKRVYASVAAAETPTVRHYVCAHLSVRLDDRNFNIYRRCVADDVELKCRILDPPEAGNVLVEFSSDDVSKDPSPNAKYRCSIMLDESRDFLPVMSRREYAFSGQTPDIITVTHNDFREVDGVLLPHSIDVMIQSPVLPDAVQVRKCRVENVRLGTVKDSDLKVMFPYKAQVVDLLRDISYVVGEDGEELNVVSLKDAAEQLKALPQ